MTGAGWLRLNVTVKSLEFQVAAVYAPNIAAERDSLFRWLAPIDFMVHHDLVDKFRLDHQGREIETWLDSFPSVRARSYQDRILFRRADTDF